MSYLNIVIFNQKKNQNQHPRICLIAFVENVSLSHTVDFGKGSAFSKGPGSAFLEGPGPGLGVLLYTFALRTES